MWSLIDHYLDRSSPLHRWHPVAKLLGVGPALVMVAAMPAGTALALALPAAALVVSAGRLPARIVLRRLRSIAVVLLAFALLVTASSLLTAPPAPAGGRLAAAAAAAGAAGWLAVRVLTIMLLAMAVLATTPFAQLCVALRRLGCPAALVQIVLLTYRTNFALAGEWESVQHALAARGFRWTASRRSLAVLGSVTGAVLVRALERADRLYHAMLARGYDGRMRSVPPPTLMRRDVLKTGLAWLATAALALSWLLPAGAGVTA